MELEAMTTAIKSPLVALAPETRGTTYHTVVVVTWSPDEVAVHSPLAVPVALTVCKLTFTVEEVTSELTLNATFVICPVLGTWSRKEIFDEVVLRTFVVHPAPLLPFIRGKTNVTLLAND